jgi:aminoacylase
MAFMVSELYSTLYFSFIADEELGGHDGMAKYVVSKEFKDLNIGFALDEGLASEDNKIPLFYGERNVFWVKFKCSGH